MAKDPSFDVVSKVDMQEVDNAINQTNKEISQRFDFKNSKSEVKLEKEEIKIIADDTMRLNSVVDILQTKLIRRNVSVKNFDYGKVEDVGGGLVKQMVKIQQGLSTDVAKEIVKDIKNMKLKVQASIQEDQVRVTGKKLDDLQSVIATLKGKEYDVDLQFNNYR
ncbi:hypothetical protein SAMN00017405_1020 [Desulfonispora thiosulfatigenes DSM 11270]|uniref:Nucleotide-binding protein SAMN00017405_1020 n=1 Tax=Desulfonispora thiosulfatigenes DSM 11270 TaxID=656914 RepID=A0A1W1UQI7_DESTI|nr:YajQ family cyclic di-GMP-binding protein [Desulfonispora thiosulfatigenes]SMB83259.1 hypothetical protein SAMN00017405_1020 [Desulfonispora thiosulfatigenes DSM 11270]